MKLKTEERIKRDLRNEIGWIEGGKEKRLDEATISTIMAIIRVNLEGGESKR